MRGFRQIEQQKMDIKQDYIIVIWREKQNRFEPGSLFPQWKIVPAPPVKPILYKRAFAQICWYIYTKTRRVCLCPRREVMSAEGHLVRHWGEENTDSVSLEGRRQGEYQWGQRRKSAGCQTLRSLPWMYHWMYWTGQSYLKGEKPIHRNMCSHTKTTILKERTKITYTVETKTDKCKWITWLKYKM